MKILQFDTEIAPNVAYTWGKYDQNVPAFVREWYMLSFAFKWLDGKSGVYALPDFKLYKRDKTNDKELVRKLWKLLDEADVVVAHNGDEFDIKRAQARFLFHGFKPTSPFKSVDTLKVLRRNFSFNSNKLDDVCQQMGFGKKVEHEGIGLWIKCMDGDRKAWKKMKEYNLNDVILLERLYLYLLPWISSHPNRNVYDGTEKNCPNCGSSKIIKRGFRYTMTNKFQGFLCESCGKNFQSKQAELSTVKVK